jgi:hypothetical protein
VNRSSRRVLLISFVVMLSSATMFAQYNSATRTSVNKNTNVNANKNVNANVNQNYNANVNKNYNANVNKNTNVNVNKNVNVNTNQNVNVNVNKNVYVHSSSYYGGSCCYNPAPVAAAVIATAIIVGTRVNTLPPACSVVYVNGLTYQHCGSTWYQPQFVGTSTTYVVVTAPR